MRFYAFALDNGAPLRLTYYAARFGLPLTDHIIRHSPKARTAPWSLIENFPDFFLSHRFI